MKFSKYILLIIYVIDLSSHQQAFADVLDTEAFNFTYLTAENGLAQNFVDDIYKDSRGYLWFATWNGLNRYDGYDFVRYYQQQTDEAHSLKNMFVTSLVEDNFHRLWVGTQGGINVIDLYSGNVLPEQDNQLHQNPISHLIINKLIKTREGQIWIGGNGCLAVVSFDSEGEIETVDMLQQEAGADILSLCQDNDGKIWIGYRNGTIRTATPVSKKAYQISDAPANLYVQVWNAIFSFCPDGDDLWIGTTNGLARYNRRSDSCRLYVNNPQDSHSLLQNYATDLALDKDGNLIVATYKGLCIYRRETDDFLQIESEENSLNNNFINTVYADRDNHILWIGTERGGVNKMTRKSMNFSVYRHHPDIPTSLAPNPVNSIFEDSNGILWVGNVEGGLNKMNPQTHSFTHFRHESGRANSLSHNSVSYITEGGGYLWIGTWGGGINRMKISDEGRFEQASEFVKEGTFSSVFISAMVYDESLQVLFVASPDGLEFYNAKTQTVKAIQDNGNHIAGSNKYLLSASHLCLSQSHKLWIGSILGLYCLDLDKSDLSKNQFALSRYHVTQSKDAEPPNEKINWITEASDQTLWIGTFGNGLYQAKRLSDGDYQFINYGTEVGLSNNNIYTILEDHSGNLWMSSDRGLSCFNPKTKRATPFYTTDGLPNNQFFYEAACRTKNGKLYFGNIEGLVALDPKEVKADDSKLSVTIVDRRLYNQSIGTSKLGELWELREQDKSFAFSFSALYYLAPEKIRYAYRMEGFDKDWTEVDADRRFANYTNLPAGKYRFLVKCTNPDGEWSDLVTQLNIRIVPPFYKESWFIALLVFIAAFALYYFNEMRIRNLRRQKERLATMVEERTHQIEEQKDEILAQKRELENSDMQLRQATQQKINFFTNITHEFKTPLTLVIGPVEQALKLSTNQQVNKQLSLVRKNSKYLLSLINQLMDFRKADAGKLKINKLPGDFFEFIDSILSPFKDLAKARKITIEVRSRIAQPNFLFDQDLIQKIIVNLLSNALKFTPDEGHITLTAAQLPGHDSTHRHLYLAVSDTGCGVPESAQKFIFDRFYQVENSPVFTMQGQTGTGIGLYLCRQIVDLLGGQISVKNKATGGALFRVVLPIEETDLHVTAPISTQLTENVETIGNTKIEDDENEIEDTNEKPLLLIIEDNADMRIFIHSILENTFRVIEATDGKDGLEKTLSYVPNFIITDIMMPIMDGLELCRKIRNNFLTSHIPILLLTAKSSTDVRIEGYRSGADAYIAKPFDAELLMAQIQSMMEGRNRLHQAFKRSMDVKSLAIQEESQDHVFLDRFMNIIQENYQDATFDVTELIAKIHISKSLLHKKLQSLIGQPAVQVIRTYRLTKAKEILESNENTSLSIAEVAYQVGFNDPKYFTRCFTKHFGIAPSEV